MEMKIDGNHCKLPNDDYWRQSKTINHRHNNQLGNFVVNWNLDAVAYEQNFLLQQKHNIAACLRFIIIT